MFIEQSKKLFEVLLFFDKGEVMPAVTVVALSTPELHDRGDIKLS